MKAELVKTLPMESLLRQEGIVPVKWTDTILWYRSPFRSEDTPSFKVDKQKNLWYDFGLGEGGDIITFVMKYKKMEFMKALQYMEPILLGMKYLSESKLNLETVMQAPSTNSGIMILSAKPIIGGPLMEYLHSRMITDNNIIRKHCSAVTYLCHGKKYFAVGFRNNSGGYELRNKYAKLASAPKDVTLVPGDERHDACCVFEGFIDYLSFLMINHCQQNDCLVLNSVAMIKKAVPILREYQKTELYMDNDGTGHNITKQLTEVLFPKTEVTDHSSLFFGYKDLNEYLCNNQANEMSCKQKIKIR